MSFKVQSKKPNYFIPMWLNKRSHKKSIFEFLSHDCFLTLFLKILFHFIYLEMQATQERVVKFTRLISRLFYDNIDVEEAVESMRSQNVSSELIKSIYTQLSNEVDELRERFFYYYTSKVDKPRLKYRVGYWTSRYLITSYYESSDSAFHEIEIIDLFNDKSM
jgi:hypothetical protein